MSTPLEKSPLESRREQKIETESSLKGTLVAVFILGTLIVLGWGSAFLLYLSRT
ncbi:MAG: cytochrome c oxidase subunit 2A [Thermicanus sp.]|nr:cytochrome c oxidase subunit 2A [Thermicanus sp.]